MIGCRGRHSDKAPIALRFEISQIEQLCLWVRMSRYRPASARAPCSGSRPRSADHVWEPRRQRPELWHLYNSRLGPGESIRVFPVSNWTELDVWEYIEAERIEVVPFYFAKPRPVVRRGGAWIMLDDDRLPLLPGERPELRRIRFRTLGC
jgi:3'-phosphoadenosine 5'-phosphosulfate sulfotransferase (PAPS reductase)/FAD synthetase